MSIIKKRAFTLVELLAVVVILAILSGIGIYSVTKIINKTRVDSLNKTALVIKRAVNTYLSSNKKLLWVDNKITLDLTPGNGNDIERGDDADLVGLSKDPWGKDYESVLAIITRDNKTYLIDIYITLSNGDVYELPNNINKISKLIFEFNPLSVVSTATTGQDIKITLGLSDYYDTPNIISCKLVDESNQEIDNSKYFCGNLVDKGRGIYELPVKIYVTGKYHFKLSYNSSKENMKTQLTTEILVTNSMQILMPESYSIYQNQSLSISLNVTGNVALSSITNAGNSVVPNPQLNTNYTFQKTYTTVGTKNEEIIVADIFGNVKTKTFVVEVISVPAATISNVTATPGPQRITISGSVASGNALPIAKWQYKVGVLGTWTDIAASASLTMPTKIITSLTNGTSYTIYVRAVDSGGNFSNEKTVTAIPTGYTVTFQIIEGSGTLSGNLNQIVAQGGTTTIVTAAPAAGWSFSRWNIDGVNVSFNTSYALTNVTKNTVVNAYFYIPVDSCPFLFVWDGNKYKYESDIYPMGRLGALTSKGYTKPEPNDYYVINTEPKLKDGKIEAKITTESNEAHYTDELKLYAIDLPIDKSLSVYQPQRGMSYKVLTDAVKTVASDKKNVIRATLIDDNNKDITSQVSKIDGIYGILNPNREDPKPQTIELDLGDQSTASKIKLAVMASAYTPQTEEGRAKMLPTAPKVQVPNEIGEWTTITTNAGKPGEYQREYLIDLTDKFLTNDYRVRITYTNSVYFDAILVDNIEELEYSVNELSISSATLNYHGKNPATIYGYLPTLNYGKPTKYVAYLEGFYTKFGDVTPLLQATDDKFVITGSGDQITVKWDPLTTEVAPGYKRHYVLYSNGYYKYLLMPLEPTVTPLPFAAMSNFPYQNSEKYPDDYDHLQYQKEWNTRWQPNTSGEVIGRTL